MQLYIMLGISGIGLLLTVVFALSLTSKKKKSKKGGKAKTNKNFRETEKAYRFLNENFLTRKGFRRVVEQLSNLSVYNFLEIRELAVKYYLQTTGISIGMILLAAIIFKDITAVLLVGVFAFVMYDILITKKLNAAHYAVVKELSVTLSSIREYYTRSGDIPDSINECKKGKHLQAAMDKIYLILTSNNAEEKLEEFYRTVPFHMLQTLAGVCYVLNDVGDEQTETGGSVFKNAITLLKNDTDAEIRKYVQQRVLFQSLEFLPLAPLPFLGVLKWFFVTYIPGTATIYNGFLGYIAQTLVILASMGAYAFITSVNNPTAVRVDDRNETIDKLCRQKTFKKFIATIVPKKMRVRNRVQKLIKGALSSKDITYMYASKFLAAALGFTVTLSLLTVFTIFSRDYIYNNLLTSSLVGGTPLTVEEDRTMREVDAYVLSLDKCPNEEALRRLVENNFPKMITMDVEEHIDRLQKKYEDYSNAHFHWYYIIISYIIAFGAWCVPDILLVIRKKLVVSEAQEDVLQLQTMLAILMYTNLDTLEVLYWLGRQSRVHKDALTFAYHEYPSDPEKALTRLRDKSAIPEFQQMIESMISTIYQVSLLDAFGDLNAERAHTTSLRETVQMQAIKNKRSLASPVSKAPLLLTAAGYVLMPIGVLGFYEIMKMVTQLTGGI